MNTQRFYDTSAAAAKIERERQLITRGIDPFASIARTVQASATVIPPPPRRNSAFDAGIQAERDRVLFAERLRIAIARKLSNRAEGSQDEISKALLVDQEPQFRVEVVLPPLPKELTKEQQDFAARLIARIKTMQPIARRR